ncbi:MAG: putative DNA binding domain-containing protein [Xanthomonadales bacterium]|jgi:ATP-dependent DNA helicase RecG|nr:putative DNA binding domain-containing protein [Xanthomonadales bacterium]
MSSETQHFDRKSLALIDGPKADWQELAKDCVCFANAAGGVLHIGIEDGQTLPPPTQRIAPALLDRVRRRISELTVNVSVAPEIERAGNGGEYLRLTVARAVGVASTQDGRYYLRVGDSCQPIRGDDVLILLNERPQVPWETLCSLAVPVSEADADKVAALLSRLRASDRLSERVKQKSDAELLAHFGLSDAARLTNLGVLLIGTATQRARLGTAPVIQALKHDELGQRINKWRWDDYTLSPVELVEAVWREIPDFHESYELPDGLFRQRLPAFDPRVVRELLVNALVHRPYTQGGDIFLNLYPDRLEVVNPGRLPLGVTPQNILHASRRRNERLATLFHDLQLMEKEGSGFDLLYEVQLSQGRALPIPREGPDRVSVTVGRRVLRPEIVKLMTEATEQFRIGSHERICLGLLAAGDGLTARELAEKLELADVDELQTHWLGRLVEFGLVEASGKTQARHYFVNPALLRGRGLDGRTTLKRMEPHRLRALIVEDVGRYPGSSSSDIQRRAAPELTLRTIRRALDELVESEKVRFEGEKRWRRYWLDPKGHP